MGGRVYVDQIAEYFRQYEGQPVSIDDLMTVTDKNRKHVQTAISVMRNKSDYWRDTIEVLTRGNVYRYDSSLRRRYGNSVGAESQGSQGETGPTASASNASKRAQRSEVELDTNFTRVGKLDSGALLLKENASSDLYEARKIGGL